MSNPSNPYDRENLRGHGLIPEDPSVRPAGETVVDGTPDAVKSDRAGAEPDLTGAGQVADEPTATDPGDPVRRMPDDDSDDRDDDDHTRRDSPKRGDVDVKDEAKRTASNVKDRASEVADTVKDKASQIADTATGEGQRVTDTVKDEAGNVFDETKHQTRRIVDEGMDELRQQAGAGQQRLAEVVRSLSGELESMTGSTSESGPVVQFATRVQRLGGEAASWLENTSSDDVVASVRRFAARRPWAFLAISAGVGFVAARLVRSLSEGDDSQPGNRRVESDDVRRLAAPSYDDDQDRLGSRPQAVGGAPLASEIRGEHHTLSAEEEILAVDRQNQGGAPR